MVLKVHNLDKCLKKIGDISKIDFTIPVSRSGIAIQNRARDLVPVDTGQLQQSINLEAIDGNFNNGARIYASTEYAIYVEFGTSAPHFVPFVINGEETGLRGWAERHGFDTSKMTGMVVSGKPQPYMLPAFKQEKKKAEERIIEYARKELVKISRQ